MDKNSPFGTNADGSKNEDYCSYCYKDGEFCAPNMTMEEMINICLPHMVGDQMDEKQARAILEKTLPQLKRWKKD